MILKYDVKTALKGLSANKSRTGLTLLGIIIGVMAIIIVMSVGAGAQELILGQIRGMGSQTISIEPGREPKGPSGFTEIFTDSLKPRDIVALKNKANVAGIKEITPNVIQVATIAYENETVRTNVFGSSELMAKILDVYPSEGAFFTDEDISQKASVAVIGSEVREKLFGESDAVGEKIRIKDRVFRVVGTLSPKGQVALFNVDDMVMVPYTTAQEYLLGINYFHSITVQAETEEIVPRVMEDIRLTLREVHNIDDPEKDDFHVMSQADAAERVKTITGILTALLVAVAAISLLVGGIGIMNIMLVSVTERTREIGLRKSLGATNTDIMTQFLLEAVLLTMIGGLLGILSGAAFSFTASFVLSKTVAAGWTFEFPVSAAVIGCAVSGAIGLIFGLYPARAASRKSPIEALRYE